MKNKTKIRFVWFEGEVLAVFMGKDSNRSICPGYRDCYSHIGQHGRCYDGMQRRNKARPDEYKDLKSEMESIGYNLIVM